MVEERAVGPDHEHARAGESIAVRIEQPRRSVQARPRSCRSRGALDTDGRAQVGPDDLVLLGWIVATMARMGPTRGRSISCWRIALRPAVSLEVGQVLILVCRGLPLSTPNLRRGTPHPG